MVLPCKRCTAHCAVLEEDNPADVEDVFFGEEGEEGIKFTSEFLLLSRSVAGRILCRPLLPVVPRYHALAVPL
jgi:hypothetical protein